MATLPAAFGLDLACGVRGLDTTRTATGMELYLQALLNRYRTPRERLLDDPSYGYDLSELLSDEFDYANPRTILEVQSGVRAEALKDDRTETCFASVAFESAARRLLVTIRGECAEGPYEMTIAATAVSVEMLKGGAA